MPPALVAVLIAAALLAALCLWIPFLDHICAPCARRLAEHRRRTRRLRRQQDELRRA